MSARWFLLLALCLSAHGQPFEGTNPLANLDANRDGDIDFQYRFSQEHGGTDPDRWSVAFGFHPWATSRFLQFSRDRVPFRLGEWISSESSVYLVPPVVIPGLPPGRPLYGLGLMEYDTVFVGEWVTTSSLGLFEKERQLLIGIRVVAADGLHYGWIRLSRPDLDLRTPFVIDQFETHPVPEEGIAAGERPALPVPAVERLESGVRLKWDARWGPLKVETSPGLLGENWKPLDGDYVGGADLSVEGAVQFFRLTWP